MIVGLDIGSSKVSVVVGEQTPEGKLEVVGLSNQPAKGMKAGMVSNIDLMVNAIKAAIEEAESMANCRIGRLYAGISGPHIQSRNLSGVAAIHGNEVTHDDVSRVIDSARAVKIPSDEIILHVLPQSFTIDDHDDIRDPIGLCGYRLESSVHVVTCNSSAVQNILKCVRQCNLQVDSIILDLMASAHAVLTEDEKELGVGLIDIGEGTMDLAVYHEGSVQHSTSFGEAGAHITKELAVILNTPTSEAKKIKHRYGSAVPRPSLDGKMLELTNVGNLQLSRISPEDLSRVIQVKVTQMFELIHENLVETNTINLIPSGLVLTGGTSRLDKIDELAAKYFSLPVRIGVPQYSGPLAEVVCHPVYSTVFGLCDYGLANRGHFNPVIVKSEAEIRNTNVVDKFLNRLRGLYGRSEPQYMNRTQHTTSTNKRWIQNEY